MNFIKLLFFILISTLITANQGLASLQENVSDFILKRCQYLERFKNIPVCSTCVSSQTTIPNFYRERGYRPAWTKKSTINELLDAIKDSYDHGLNPDDYHLKALQKLEEKIHKTGVTEPSLLADYDILLTDALLRLSFHLFYGKVSPESLDPNWNFKRRLMDIEPHKYLSKVIRSGNIKESLKKLSPDAAYYNVLKRWLRKYREFAKNPWPLVPSGKTLKLGMKSHRIKILKQRLIAEGFLSSHSNNITEIFDDSLFESVKAFQKHHGLSVDGVVGRDTLHALNILPKDKINQIRVNLERARWLLHDLPRKFLLVNIAD